MTKEHLEFEIGKFYLIGKNNDPFELIGHVGDKYYFYHHTCDDCPSPSFFSAVYMSENAGIFVFSKLKLMLIGVSEVMEMNKNELLKEIYMRAQEIRNQNMSDAFSKEEQAYISAQKWIADALLKLFEKHNYKPE